METGHSHQILHQLTNCSANAGTAVTAIAMKVFHPGKSEVARAGRLCPLRPVAAPEYVAGARIVPRIDCPSTGEGIFILFENIASTVLLLGVAPFLVRRSVLSNPRRGRQRLNSVEGESKLACGRVSPPQGENLERRAGQAATRGRCRWSSRLMGRIGIGGHLAMPPLPHHRAYGSVPRRFDWVTNPSASNAFMKRR